MRRTRPWTHPHVLGEASLYSSLPTSFNCNMPRPPLSLHSHRTEYADLGPAPSSPVHALQQRRARQPRGLEDTQREAEARSVLLRWWLIRRGDCWRWFRREQPIEPTIRSDRDQISLFDVLKSPCSYVLLAGPLLCSSLHDQIGPR